MATLYGTNSQLRNNTPQDMVDVAELGGRVRISSDSWTADAAQNDVVVLGFLPKGAKLHMVQIAHTAMGSSVTAEIGFLGATVDDDDAIATGYDISGAGSSTFINPQAAVSEDVDIVVTLESANPDSGTIELLAYYSID